MAMTRDELIELVKNLVDLKIPEEQEEDAIATLKRETSDPNVTDYIYYADPPLSAEDVVDLALGLRQIKWTRFEP